MSIFFAHLNQSVRLIQEYKGQTPLSIYLKQFFQSEKKYGSKDRKTIANLCYQYFRCANLFGEPNANLEENVIKAHVICSNSPSPFLKKVNDSYLDLTDKTLEIKLEKLGIKGKVLFPFGNLLSKQIPEQDWQQHFLQQPKVFARIRKNSLEQVKKALSLLDFSYQLDQNCLMVESATKLEAIGQANLHFVVQDASSQASIAAVSSFLKGDSIWDCCAASGGKALYVSEYFPKAKITATDIRESILQNLKSRFSEAKLPLPKLKALDLSKAVHFNNKFQNIIADVPCSGSGTWSRTPEAMHYFSEKQLEKYQTLQRSILSNSVVHLLSGGIFIYITCSVFKAENEDNVQYLLKNHPLELLQSNYQKGYNNQADTMFWAVFRSK
jgi:16S rRNA (cytosine967-C5)-methyltransferase